MMRDNAKRRRQYARRKQLFEQLRLQGEILCDSHDDEGRSTVVLNRMMKVILSIIGNRKINATTRQALADHFADSAYDATPEVSLGGAYERDMLYLSGTFNISDLAKRLVWTEARTETIW